MDNQWKNKWVTRSKPLNCKSTFLISTTETKFLNSLCDLWLLMIKTEISKGQLVYQFKSSESPKSSFTCPKLPTITHMNSIYKVCIFMENIFIIKSKSVDKNQLIIIPDRITVNILLKISKSWGSRNDWKLTILLGVLLLKSWENSKKFSSGRMAHLHT